MRFRPVVLVFPIFLASVGALAQSHGHHGGGTQKIGAYEGELVVKGREVTLFLMDENDKKIDASKLRGSAVVLAKGNEQKTLELAPAGENKLAGKVDFPIEGKFRATVIILSGSAEVGKARYSLDQAR